MPSVDLQIDLQRYIDPLLLEHPVHHAATGSAGVLEVILEDMLLIGGPAAMGKTMHQALLAASWDEDRLIFFYLVHLLASVLQIRAVLRITRVQAIIKLRGESTFIGE